MVKVVDDDTIDIVAVTDESEATVIHIRLWGVDAPEIAKRLEDGHVKSAEPLTLDRQELS